METGIIDLHVHSTCSDGTLTPTELVRAAFRRGLCAFALTDHDCVLGIREAQDAAAAYPVEVISGVELSCEQEGREIHIVGLFIDAQNETLNEKLASFCHSRDTRNRRMVERLQQEAGLDIDYESLLQEFPDSVITRAHIAKYLVMHHQVKDMNTVFSKYIGDDCRFYVARPKITPQEGIQLIHDAGGLAILAHPILYHMSTTNLERLVQTLTSQGLDGIEAVYSTYQPGDESNLKKLAAKYNLLISGGSDFHGANKPHISLGQGTRHMPIPAYLLTELKKRYDSK